MNRVVVGGLLGSSGTVLYLRPELLAQLKSPISSTSPYGSDIREIQQLIMCKRYQRFVCGHRSPTSSYFNSFPCLQLATLKSDVQGLHTSDKASNVHQILLYCTMAAVSVLGARYIASKVSWSDWWYVSKKTFVQGIDNVYRTMEAINRRLSEVKLALQRQMQQVIEKQDSMMESQKAMEKSLAAMSDDVLEMKARMSNIDLSLDSISIDQRHALYGIMVLCQSVKELTEGHASSLEAETRNKLTEYTKSLPIANRGLKEIDTILNTPQNAFPIFQRTSFSDSTFSSLQGISTPSMHSQ
eukprot:jgi/Picsp_1/791/NSC_04280-R1_hypothetical protein CHLNCDRAFT_141417 [Chlorella variabilis]